VIEDRGFIQSVLSEIRDMGDNVFFDLIQEQAMEKGIEKGRAEEARRAVLRVVLRRFGTVPDEVRSRVEAAEALDRLERLHDEAITCPSLDAFRELFDRT